MIKVNIDAGHGSNTAGKRTCKFTKDVKIGNGTTIKKGETYKEHYANVMVADFLWKELKRCGKFKLYKTGWDDSDASDDEDISLTKRQNRIKANGCEISISVHFNAYGTDWNDAQGVGTFIHAVYPKDSKKLADYVQAQLAKGTEQKNRGVKSEKFSMVNNYKMGTKASILCELAFMTNKHEAMDLMANVDYCKECAVEIAKGLCKYCGVDYVKEEEKETVKEETPEEVKEVEELKKVEVPLKVRVLDDDLNIRKGSGTQYDVVGQITDKGVYTIVDVNEKCTWGKLKSGAGWICITEKYVEIV